MAPGTGCRTVINAMRICSFVPGATEIVAAIGLGDSLVGRSHECDYPPELASVPALTRSTLQPASNSSADIDGAVRTRVASGLPLSTVDVTALAAAAPDLVITQELCHVCGITPSHIQDAGPLYHRTPRQLASSPSCLEDILTDVARIGDAVDARESAARLVEDLRARREAVRHKSALHEAPPRVICLEWLDPFYTAGHWIPEMVALAGGREVLGQAGAPSHRVEWNDLENSRPDILILMPCGFSALQAGEEYARMHSRWPWDVLPAVQSGRVFAVDANAYFSRPGPRLFRGLEILADLFTTSSLASTPPGSQRCAMHRRQIELEP